MDKKIKIILKLNILCYVNNFLYIFVSSQIEIKNILALWILSPFVFLFLISFILENKYHLEYRYLKKYAISDFIIRFIGACVAFTELGLSFNAKILISIIFIILNVVIELKMLKIEPKIKDDEKIHIITSKIDLNEGYKSVFLGVSSVICTMFIFGVIWGGYSLNAYMLVILSVVCLIIFSRLEFMKIRNFHKERKVVIKLLIINIGVFTIGVIIWVVQKILFKEAIYDNITILILAISLLPSIESTRNIAVTHKNILKDRY